MHCDKTTLKLTIMKTLKFKSEADTEEKVLELAKSGAHFRVIGRRAILIW